jgi:hypothetical protein
VLKAIFRLVSRFARTPEKGAVGVGVEVPLRGSSGRPTISHRSSLFRTISSPVRTISVRSSADLTITEGVLASGRLRAAATSEGGGPKSKGRRAAPDRQKSMLKLT